jgi:hypothetical protein
MHILICRITDVVLIAHGFNGGKYLWRALVSCQARFLPYSNCRILMAPEESCYFLSATALFHSRLTNGTKAAGGTVQHRVKKFSELFCASAEHSPCLYPGRKQVTSIQVFLTCPIWRDSTSTCMPVTERAVGGCHLLAPGEKVLWALLHHHPIERTVAPKGLERRAMPTFLIQVLDGCQDGGWGTHILTDSLSLIRRLRSMQRRYSSFPLSRG